MYRQLNHNPIPTQKLDVAVIVEPREHKYLVRVVMNILNNTSNYVKIQIFHGTMNENFIMTSELAKYVVNGKILLTNLGVPNLTIKDYNNLLVSTNFWNSIDGENILIFQTDSCICSKSRHTIDEYLQYDYVGAPWEKNSKDKHKYGGNGGFSFRKKSAMLSVINKFPYNKEHEDVYFSRKDIKYPPYKVAKTFAVEHVFYDAPFGIHKAYKYQSKNKLNNMLEYCPELQTIFDIKN